MLKTHISMFSHLLKRPISYRLFSRRQIAIFHTSHTWSLLSSEKFFTFCKGIAGISFEFNYNAVIVKVHFLFRDSGTRRAVPLNFVPEKFQLALFSITFHITMGITLPRFLSARNIESIACHFVIRHHFVYPSHILSILLLFRFPIYPTSCDGKFFTQKPSVSFIVK